MSTNNDNQMAVLETEIQVLSALMLDVDSISEVSRQLAPSDFQNPVHSRIFATMLRLDEKGNTITVPTLTDALGNHLDEIDGVEYLQKLWTFPAIIGSAKDHAALIRKKRQCLDLARIGSDTVHLAREGIEDLPLAIDGLVDQLLAVSHDPSAGQMISLNDELGSAIKASEDASRGNLEASGLSTGFDRLDDIIGGLRPNSLIYLAARPSMGKSALSLNIASSVVENTDKTVLLFNLEMCARELAYRQIAGQGDIDAHRPIKGRLTNDEWNRSTEACNDLWRNTDRLRVLDQCYLTPAIMRAHIRREIRKSNVGLVIVDYLQLMSSGQRRENQNVEVAAISRGLKVLARDFSIPILALSQLSRGIENRSDSLPRLADLRDSGSLEQDADCVIFIHRAEGSDIAELIVAKQRNGPRGKIELHWNPKSIKFSNKCGAAHD